MNNVKWVDELRVMGSMVVEGSLDRPGEHAYWQQQSYRIHPPGVEPDVYSTIKSDDTWEQLEGAVEHPYTFDATVMSVIGTPSRESPVTLRADDTIEVRGVAWADDDAVEQVEVSTDGGETWSGAELFGPAYDGAWRLYRYDWDTEPGTHVLMSRAKDELGR